MSEPNVPASKLDYDGCLAFYGRFWWHVVHDLAGRGEVNFGQDRVVPGAIVRAATLAWVLDEALTYDDRGNPVSFRAWCRFGGLDLDPVWWRECLIAGKVPAGLKCEEV